MSIPYFGYLISLLAFSGSIYVIAFLVSKFVSNHIKEEKNIKATIALWLLGTYKDTWASQFCNYFDAIFGKNPLSLRFFFCSCLASLFAILLLYIGFNLGFNIFGENGRTSSNLSLGQAFLIGVALNFIPDYLSLCETRWLLKRFSKIESVLGQLTLLFIDFIASFLIISLYLLLVIPFIDESSHSIMKLVAIFSIYSIFFYSTFLTSAWAWIYCLSTWLIRVSTKFSNLLKVKEKPIEQIGLIGFILTLFFGLLLIPLIAQEESGKPNLIEQWACKISSDTCEDVAKITKDEYSKLLWFAEACKGGQSKHCVETGIKYMDSNREESLALFTKACNLHIAIGCYNRGVLLQDLDQPKEVEAAYRQAIQINPKHADAHYNLGVLLYDTDHLKEAESAYRQAIQINPKYAKAYYNLGVLLYDTGHLKEAESAYRQAIQINPKYAKAYYNLGVLLYDTGHLKEAENAYRQAIHINPKDASAYYNLGILLRKTDRPEEAESAYRQAIQINPKDTNAHYNLGILLDKTGRPKEAESAFRQVIELNPDDNSAKPNLKIILETKND